MKRKPNEIWAMDFMRDQLADGRRLPILPVIDTYTRECLAIDLDTSLTGERVVRVLERLRDRRRYPGKIMVTNGNDPVGELRFEYSLKRFSSRDYPLV